LANKVQNLPSSQRPNTVAVITHSNGTVTIGRNRGSETNKVVYTILENAPKNEFGGQCAEINAISRALNKGRDLEGAKINITNVRGPNSTNNLHGSFKEPCSTCTHVINQFNLSIEK